MKFIAALCMLIDHIGFVFYPDELGWRVIGRLAMPIFAYGIARGAFYTTSLKRYMKKMLLFSFVSQIPFWGMYYWGTGEAFFSLRLNVGFTFCFSLLAISLLTSGGIVSTQIESVPSKIPKGMKQGIAIGGTLGCILLAEFLNCDYGGYGVLMVLMGYLMYIKGRPLIVMALGYMILTFLVYMQNLAMVALQGMGVMAYGVIYATYHLSEKRFGKFFYWFYPVHMLLIGGIKWWMIKG